MTCTRIPACAHGMMCTAYIPEHLVCRNVTEISNGLREIIIAQSLITARSPLVAWGSGVLKNNYSGFLLEKIR